MTGVIRWEESTFVLTDPLGIGNVHPLRLLLNGISSVVPVSNSAHEPAPSVDKIAVKGRMVGVSHFFTHGNDPEASPIPLTLIVTNDRQIAVYAKPAGTSPAFFD